MEPHVFVDRMGRSIELEFDEDPLKCNARHQGKKVGALCFNELYSEFDSSVLLLTNCYLESLEGFKRCGIGEEMIRLVVECGYSVYARRPDGITREDGSHLTQDAPGFIAAMVRKGLVAYAD